jgi:cysteine desulfurase family protein (TIGR01976 family)
MLMTDAIDVAARPLFPALARTEGGRPAAFLDGPGGSQMPGTAIDAMAGLLRAGTANDGGVFATSRETIDLIAQARRAAAVFTGSEPEEIAFGANMTTLNFLLAHAVARTLQPGDEIIVTELDHDANIAPWLAVAADHDLVVRTAPVTAEATLDTDALEALIGARTRIVAFTLASNAVGSITDARRIAEAAHRAGALAWADAVHFAPHRRPDRRALGVDVLLCSPYKFFGPHLGLAAIRRDLAETWPADRVRPASEDPPGHRFETGTPSFEALAGFVAAVDYLAGLGAGETLDARLDAAYARMRQHEEALSRHVLARLAAIDGLTLHGIADATRVAQRTPTFCFTLEAATPGAVSEHLASRGIFTWDGNYYALALMEALGLESRGGAVRAGFLHYNTLEEADRLADAVAEIAAGAAPATASEPRRDEAPA